MAVCKSCGSRVVWVRTEAKGNRPARMMPLDATEDGQALVATTGNVVLIGTEPDGRTPTARVVARNQGKHVSHFATCPHAKEHRKAKGAAR